MKKQNNEKKAKNNFISDVKNHEMRIMKDEGVYRHIVFKNPETTNQWFELVTWPGSLCISGDMGCYVFSRNNDMFRFFTDENTQDFSINPSYWAEKCVSNDKYGEIKKFSSDLFKRAVVSDFKEWIADEFPPPPRDEESKSKILSCWEAIEDYVLSCDESEVDSYSAADRFKHDTGFKFIDFWDHNFNEFTHHYIWCLYAIVWGIQKYNSEILP